MEVVVELTVCVVSEVAPGYVTAMVYRLLDPVGQAYVDDHVALNRLATSVPP